MVRLTEERTRLFREAAEFEKELEALREAGVSEEGIATFRRLYPRFKKIFKWEDPPQGGGE